MNYYSSRPYTTYFPTGYPVYMIPSASLQAPSSPYMKYAPQVIAHTSVPLANPPPIVSHTAALATVPAEKTLPLSVSAQPSRAIQVFMEKSVQTTREINEKNIQAPTVALVKEEDYVTKDFIDKFNDQRGNPENIKEAKRKIAVWSVAAGLKIPSEREAGEIVNNLTDARINLVRLLSCEKEEVKVMALDALLQILEKDDFSESNAAGLVEMTLGLSELLHGERIQLETVAMQIKIAQVYSFALGAIRRHFAKGQISGVIKECKTQLIHSASTLKWLNRTENVRLRFFAGTAREGSRRIPDDRRELYDIFMRIFHGIVAIGSIFPSFDGSTFS